jgi:hypothetical protein
MITDMILLVLAIGAAIANAQEGRYDTGEPLPDLDDFWDEIARPQQYQHFKQVALSYWGVMTLCM